MATATLKKPKSAKSGRTVQPAQLMAVLIEQIELHPHDLRDDCPDCEIGRLANSIMDHGLAQPILLRPVAGKRFQVVAGGRRFRAAKKAGLKRVEALIRPMSDSDALIAMMMENVERKDLNPVELAKGLHRLTLPVDEGGAGQSQDQIANAFGHTQGWVANVLRMLKLPKVWQDRLSMGEVTMAQARELLTFAKSEAVMAAIELDYKENKPLYDGWRGFKKQVELIASEHPAVTGPQRWRPAALPESEEAAERPTQTRVASNSIASRALPKADGPSVERFPAESEKPSPPRGRSTLPADLADDLADSIVEQIDLLDTIAQLDRVQEAIDSRRERLRRGAA